MCKHTMCSSHLNEWRCKFLVNIELAKGKIYRIFYFIESNVSTIRLNEYLNIPKKRMVMLITYGRSK
jgi:hypothetical protein